MIDHDELRDLAKTDQAAAAAIATYAPTLRDRAAVPVARTGFGSRASGAEPTISPGHTMVTTDDSWECLGCGAQGRQDMSVEDVIAAMADHADETNASLDYSDPTGNMAGRPAPRDPVAADWRQLERIMRDRAKLGDLAVQILATNQLISAPVEQCPDDWCRSCWRDDKHHEPVGVRADGTAYYRGLCRWCGAWGADHPVKGAKPGDPRLYPPLVLVEKRHRTGKDSLSTRDIAEAIEAELIAKRALRKANRKGAA